MIIKEHTRNQKRMYRIHKMEEQIEKDKYIIGTQQQEIERLNKELEELKHIMYMIRDDNGLNHLWCKDIVLEWLKGDDN